MKSNKPETPKELLAGLDRIAVGLAILTALAGLLRVALVRPWSEALNDQALKYFAVAGGLLLLRKVKSISFGDTKVEMQELKQAVETLKEDVTELGEETKTTASVAQHLSVPSGAQSGDVGATSSVQPSASEGTNTKARSRWDRKLGNAENDPWKGVFGGKAENKHRRLRADVVESKNNPGWYRVRLWVGSTNPDKHPLTDRVRFFLHDEFPSHKPFIPVSRGQAELRLHAYGAFTVGALADDGV